MSEQLKPCPFCGSSNIGTHGTDKDVVKWCSCRDCGANGPISTTKSPEWGWNRRVRPTPSQSASGPGEG
jgi:Lar family restriction alleviation protein